MFEIYGTSSCPWCDKAKSLLKELDIPFDFFNIEENPQALVYFKKQFEGKKTVPQIQELLGSPTYKYIGGYEDLVKRLSSTIEAEVNLA